MKRMILAVAILGFAFAVNAQTSSYTFTTNHLALCRLGPLLNCTFPVDNDGGTIQVIQKSSRDRFDIYINTPQLIANSTDVFGTLETVHYTATCSPLFLFTLTVNNQLLNNGQTVSMIQYFSKFQKSYGRSTACLNQVLAGGTTTVAP